MSFGSSRGSSAMSVNLADFAAFPVYLISLLALHEFVSMEWSPVDIAATVSLGEGHMISIAAILALASLGWVAYSNDWSGNLSWIQAWVVIATVTLIIAPPFVPALEGTLAATPAAFLALVVQIGGYLTFSYIG